MQQIEVVGGFSFFKANAVSFWIILFVREVRSQPANEHNDLVETTRWPSGVEGTNAVKGFIGL